jgi:O-6-methylguanine DNA methyltransferase
MAVVRAIPAGRVATYGDVAAMAGRPRAARAVGAIMRTCDDPGAPCHRVISAGGQLGGFGGSPHLKGQLLSAEGIGVAGRKVRGFARIRWRPASGLRAAAAHAPARGATAGHVRAKGALAGRAAATRRRPAATKTET